MPLPKRITTAILEDFVAADRIAATEEDISAARRYLNGPQTCAKWDVLEPYVQMIVDQFKRSHK